MGALTAGKWAEMIKEAADFISGTFAPPFDAAIILGSGLGGFCASMENSLSLDYGQIPHFPASQIEGHQGKLWWGKAGNKSILVMAGRFHYYQGYSAAEVIFPLRVMAALNIKTVIITNAAGGINLSFKPGTLMLISDHINLSGMNPLIGEHYNDWGPRFPSLTHAYSDELRALAKKAAAALDIPLAEGIYIGVSGPSYETPAEINFFRLIGGSAVGMSTVAEVIAANQLSMNVLGISCITNIAANTDAEKPDHREVLNAGEKAAAHFIPLMQKILEYLP
jgi:purine-nucleoside phosphorylase